MKNNITLLLIIICCLYSSVTYSQEAKVYSHQTLNFKFSAPDNWVKVEHGTDQIYEMMSPDSAVHVKLWYTETEQDAKKYLMKMSDMKGLNIYDSKPLEMVIDGKESWILKTNVLESKQKIETWLAVIHNGQVVSRPKEYRLFIIQIWCSDSLYSSRFEDILSSVKIN